MSVTAPRRTRTTVAPDMVSVAQVATLLSTSPDSVRRWIHAGDLEAVRLPSGRLRIPIDSLRRLQRTGVSA